MDCVPFDFSQRALALRKCCESWGLCSCARPCFAAQKWTEPRTEPIHISFHIGPDNGRCKYFFRNDGAAREHLSMDELMKFPRLYKNVRLSKMFIWEDNTDLVKHDVVDIEKLLNFVSLIANEPALVLHQRNTFFESPNGKELLEWLAERWFSHIHAPMLKTIEHRIVEKQFSRWKPTAIKMDTVRESKAFLENRLMSGDLRRLHVDYDYYDYYNYDYHFSTAVLQRIIQNVLEAPEDYAKKTLDIQVRFEDSAKEEMKQLAEDGLCAVEELPESLKYTFEKRSVVLTVEIAYRKWRICSKMSS